MKRDDTKKNFTSLSGNDLQTVRLHYPSFPCIIAIVPVSRLLNLMRYSSVLNANIRFFCSENRNFLLKITIVRKVVFPRHHRIFNYGVRSKRVSQLTFGSSGSEIFIILFRSRVYTQI